MKCVVHNNTNATIVLPACFNSYPLPANGTKDFLYSTINGQDRLTLMTLATTTPATPQNPLFPNSSVDFPGDAGLGIPAGLPINNNNLLYTLNGQEPSDMPVGANVFSMTDNETRRFTASLFWVTDGRSKWLPAKKMSVSRSYHGIAALPNGKILVVGGSSDAGVRVSACEFYDPNNDKWTDAPTLPVPMSGMWIGVYPSGYVVVAGNQGNLSGSGVRRERARTNSFVLDLNNLSGGWVTTKPLPIGMTTLFTGGNYATLLGSGKMLIFGGIDSISHGGNPTTGVTSQAVDSATDFSLLFTLNTSVLANSSWDVTRDLDGSNVATLSGSGGTIAFYDHGGGLGVSTQLVKFTKAGENFTAGHFGQPIIISGAANAGNNGTFVVARVESTTEVWYFNAAAVTETGGNYSVGGAKPITQLPYRVFEHGQALQLDGKVLTAGGRIGTSGLAALIEKSAQFNPTNGQWTQKASMPAISGETETFGNPAGCRRLPGMTTLSTGKILVAQGAAGPFTSIGEITDRARKSALLYDPSDDSWLQIGSATKPRHHVKFVPVGNGDWLTVGASWGTAAITTDIFSEGSNTFVEAAKKPATPGIFLSSIVPLPNNRVMLPGGRNASASQPTFSTIIYYPGIPSGSNAAEPENGIGQLEPVDA